LKVLLEYGANVDAVNAGSWTSLHAALTSGSLPVIRLLLEHGADTSIHDINGVTVLDEALRRGNFDITQLLLEYGALLESTARHTSLTNLTFIGQLHRSAYQGKTDEVSENLQHRNIPDDSIGLQKVLDTTLHAASAAGQDKTALMLLGKGANINSTSANGRTALHLAAAYGSLDHVKLLVGRGAEIM
jgi:ankyrin repeat protein